MVSLPLRCWSLASKVEKVCGTEAFAPGVWYGGWGEGPVLIHTMPEHPQEDDDQCERSRPLFTRHTPVSNTGPPARAQCVPGHLGDKYSAETHHVFG